MKPHDENAKLKKKRSNARRSGPVGERVAATPPPGAAITAIRPLKRDPNQRVLIVGGKRFGTVPATVVESLSLRVGQIWTESLGQEYEAAVQRESVRKAALRLLGSREYGRSELIERLAKRDFDRADVEQVIADLEQHGWVCDEKAAEEAVRTATRGGPVGDALVRDRLERKGIDREVVDRKAAESAADPEAIRQFVRKRLAKMSEVKPAARYRRLAGALARRGFEQEAAEDVLRELASEIGIEE